MEPFIDTTAVSFPLRPFRVPAGLREFAASLLLALAPAPACAAERWGTQEFEVFEGQPWAVQGTAVDAAWQYATSSDKPLRASVPLTPALRKEIEDYLGQAARRMQAMGFAEPRLDGPVTRADGRRAFRVYYFDYGSTGRKGFAGFETGGALSRHIITLNAGRLTEPGPQGPRLTTKAYVDLAHELFHAVQGGSKLAATNPAGLPLWMSEGQAEAIGHDIADDLGKLPRGYNPPLRWGFRPYFTRLAVSEGDNSDAATEASYQSSSFWRYLAERAAAKGSLPGPGPAARDYGYLARFLGQRWRFTSGRELETVNRAVTQDRDILTPLHRLYPEFTAVLADYGAHRVQGTTTPAQRRETWINGVLGPCPQVALDTTQPTATVPLELNVVTARCARVVLGPDVGPLAVDFRAQVASQAIGEQLWLGEAGGARLSRAVVSVSRKGDAIASWSLVMQPGQILDVVVSNIAGPRAGAAAADPPPSPMATRAHRLGLVISIPGHVPPAPLLQTPADKRQGASRRPATQTHGHGTAQAERDPPGPARTCSWPASDFGGDCGPHLAVRLASVPEQVATIATVTGSGGLLTQVLGNAPSLQDGHDVAMAMSGRGTDAPIQITLTLPQVPYGTTGRIEGATIVVEGGGWPHAGSYEATDRLAGGQTYFPPNGVVVIDHYSPVELRGRYEASLVALPLPNASRSEFLTLPVLGRISAPFLVTRPWQGDEDYAGTAPDLTSLDSDLRRKLADAMADGRPEPSAPDAAGPDAASRATAVPEMPAAADCDCSCAAVRQVQQSLDEMDARGTGPDAGQMRQAMCLMTCLSALQACGLD